MGKFATLCFSVGLVAHFPWSTHLGLHHVANLPREQKHRDKRPEHSRCCSKCSRVGSPVSKSSVPSHQTQQQKKKNQDRRKRDVRAEFDTV